MSTGDPIPAAGSTDDFLHGLQTALQRTFGVPFDLWLQGPTWQCWRPQQECPESADVAGNAAQAIDVLEAALEEADHASAESPFEGPHSLAIPIRRVGQPPVVAVASLSITPDELLEKLGECFVSEFSLRQRLEADREELDSYAEQISRDFEEVAYLQGMAQYLGLCDISRSLDDVARTVLPPLRELLLAESLVFISAVHDPRHPTSGAAQLGQVLVSVGPRSLDDDACRRLVDRFRGAAGEQPVVMNRRAVETDLSGFPGLECFLLTPAAKDDWCAGWLLALNRAQKPATTDSPQGYPSWGLSFREYGTVEAGLMGVAAVILATHGRNVEVFQERKTLLIEIVRALINAVDAKDTYTCGHSDRVALIATRLAEELGLDAESREQLYVAGLLHDIGKIGVPDEVLQKPGKLAEHEFAQIKQHPEHGCSILQNLDHFSYVVPTVRHHHERYDGNGYPQGLAEQEIPLAARIVAVADAYDAMSSDRPYRRAMPAERVERIMKEGAGSQWDGEIVEALLRILPDVRAIYEDPQSRSPAVPGLSETRSAAQGKSVVDSIVAAVSKTRAG
jgi:putative nucleotidyltransferase with HDIG domain